MKNINIVVAVALATSIASPSSYGADNQLAAVSLQTDVEEVAKPTPVIAPIAKAARHLRAGLVIHDSDLVFEGGSPSAVATLKELITGKEIKRTIYAGTIIPLAELGMPTVIKRNAIITIEFVRGPLVITTDGRALDPGAVGDTVRVMNLNSKITLSAVVVGANKVVTR